MVVAGYYTQYYRDLLASLPWQGSRTDLGPTELMVWGPNQARVYTEYSGQMKLLIMLCSQGNP